MMLVAGISWLWNKVSLEDLYYQRTLDQQRVFIGEETTLTITLSNRKPIPLARVEIQDEIEMLRRGHPSAETYLWIASRVSRAERGAPTLLQKCPGVRMTLYSSNKHWGTVGALLKWPGHF